MVDNKKQRKSTRSFNMEKHVERHFEIEKEEVPVADTSIEKPDSLIDGSTEENTCTSNNRGKLIAVIVVVLAILAFVAYRSCGSDQEKESEPTNTIVSDSTEKEKTDTTSNIKKAIAPEAEQEQNNVGENTDAASATPTSSDEPTKQISAPVSTSNSSVEEKAMQVWDGVYGNGTERKSKLGSDYKAVQKRVNEMYRNGYRR